MARRPLSSRFWYVGIPGLVCLCLLLAAPAEAQIQVTSANPSAAAQGTINLDVTISGKGFKRGAQAQWFVTGTVNPGGVTVNSTTFVGSTQLTANITVSDTAVISGYDVLVTNTDGRIGKGTELFSVLAKGSGVGNTCTTTGTPSGWTIVDALNRTNPDGTAEFSGIGTSVRARPADLNGDGIVDVIVVMAATGGPSLTMFLLDPVTGQRLSATAVSTDFGAGDIEVGDVNGDGIPDFATGNSGIEAAFVYLSNVTAGQLTYTRKRIDAPTDIPVPGLFGTSVALGDLDGDGRDELAIGARGGLKGSKVPGTVFVYRFENGDFVRKLVLTDPLPNRQLTDLFGESVAIGNVTGDSSGDIVVGASNAGRVFVFPGPVLAAGFDPSSYALLTVPGASTLGSKVGVGNVDGVGIPDVVASTQGSAGLVAIFSGPVSSGQTPTFQLVPPPGITTSGWAESGFDVVDVGPADGRADVLIGDPNSSNGSFCTLSVGTGYLFQSAAGWSMAGGNQATAVFQPPVLESDFMGFGFSMAGVPGYPLILIGENGANPSGQIYVYKRVP